MKPFFVRDIVKLVDGTLVKGSDELIVTDAVCYVEMMKNPNTLLFLRWRWNINWDYIKKCTPCVVVTNKDFNEIFSIEGCTVIHVENIDEAYWKFVSYYRNLFELPVIAVTGTCGKTTTKDMIKHILKYNYNVHSTVSSANSRTQHFRYLLGINEATQVAVFETPVGEPGDLINCCNYFKPTIGIITNIGVDHLAGCKTMDNYIKAKAEMLTGLNDKSVLILNADDENIKKIDITNFKGRIVYFGIHNPAHFKGTDIKFEENGMTFILKFNNMKHSVYVPGLGEHQVYNALAAISTVHELGVGIKEAAEQIRTFEKLPLHLQICTGIGESKILDDTWNTNPDSLRAALKVLKEIAKANKRVVLIGDINALGDATEEIHNQLGEMIAEIGGIDILVTVGEMTEKTAIRAAEKGLNAQIYSFKNVEGVYELLKDILDKNTFFLIKYAGYHDESLIKLKSKLKIII